MEAVIPLLLSLLTGAVPSLATGTTGLIISGIEQLVPIIIKDAPQFISQIKALIAAISSRDDITDDQLKQLQANEALLDAAFEAAARAAEAEDAAADGAASAS